MLASLDFAADGISNDLIARIEEAEGFRGHPYNDHLGNPTIGFGTLLPLTTSEARLLLVSRLQAARHALSVELTRAAHVKLAMRLSDLPFGLQDAVIEMSYQLGVRGCLNFQRMWAAIAAGDYDKAADEMLDSAWRHQTPKRCKRLAHAVRLCAPSKGDDDERS